LPKQFHCHPFCSQIRKQTAFFMRTAFFSLKLMTLRKKGLFCMNQYTRLAWRLKREILRYSQKICVGVGRPEQKLVSNLLYGIAESGSCHLSKIGRALKEKITLKKTIERLSRGLRDFSAEDGQRLLNNQAQRVSEEVDNRTVYVIDGSDVTKPYSEKLESLALVWDGSTGGGEKGYSTLEIVALTATSKSPLPGCIPPRKKTLSARMRRFCVVCVI
ncbi:MAG: hypothetical protein FWE69_07035, partial [Clostridiales bacterium]|nr:hypothetical protein [Clostridiales bacterium]